MNTNETEVVLRTPQDLIRAMTSMLLQMNKKQRKGFLMWVKDKRKQYDFLYPEGYKPTEVQPKPEIVVPTTEIQPATLADIPKETPNA